ncbi:LAGLIDADG family homing endonuclease [Bacillus sp. FJAT-45066]|uniref:LAGLIDADG family homing endonuclease n=1 Tax=Bacillus sp. FJAT-45066 TaxID=2011010 RepID=UPI000BB8275E|nr:LAGLIDADG family homing endonuclease [Bacillus sp. FJAT-45066]
MEVWEAAYVAGIIDGEGPITLSRIHANEFRRPCITIASTDLELLIYLKDLIGGSISKKKNYKPQVHKNSYSLSVKTKNEVFQTLRATYPFLRVNCKRKRAEWILSMYDKVTLRNGKYNKEQLEQKLAFESSFFDL